MGWKGHFIGRCGVCDRPRFLREWHRGGLVADSEVCVDCWFGVLDGPARKAEAERAAES